MIQGCLIIRVTITQNAWHGSPFHGVLCLSEAKGMDIKMEGCMFVVGMLAGGFVGVTAMCLFQISGMESREEEKDAFRNQKRK